MCRVFTGKYLCVSVILIITRVICQEPFWWHIIMLVYSISKTVIFRAVFSYPLPSLIKRCSACRRSGCWNELNIRIYLMYFLFKRFVAVIPLITIYIPLLIAYSYHGKIERFFMSHIASYFSPCSRWVPVSKFYKVQCVLNVLIKFWCICFSIAFKYRHRLFTLIFTRHTDIYNRHSITVQILA